MLGSIRNNSVGNAFVRNQSSYLSGVSNFRGRLHPDNTITGIISPTSDHAGSAGKMNMEELLSGSILGNLAGIGAIRLIPVSPMDNLFSSPQMGGSQARLGQSSPHAATSDLLERLSFLLEAPSATAMGFDRHFGNNSPFGQHFDMRSQSQHPSFAQSMYQHQYQAGDQFADGHGHTQEHESEVPVERPINANVNLYGRSPYETAHAIEDTLAKGVLVGSTLAGATGAYLQFGGPVDQNSSAAHQTLNNLATGKEWMALGGLGAAIAAASLYANHRSNKAMEEKREQELAFM